MSLLTWEEYRKRRSWHPRAEPRPGIRSAADFWARVEIRESTECWPWTGPYHIDGYGMAYLTDLRRGVMTHRVAWTYGRGEIPPGMHVLHRCNNKRCCNPHHLYLGTPADNGRDRAAHHAQRRALGVAHLRVNPWEPNA